MKKFNNVWIKLIELEDYNIFILLLEFKLLYFGKSKDKID